MTKAVSLLLSIAEADGQLKTRTVSVVSITAHSGIINGFSTVVGRPSFSLKTGGMSFVGSDKQSIFTITFARCTSDGDQGHQDPDKLERCN